MTRMGSIARQIMIHRAFRRCSFLLALLCLATLVNSAAEPTNGQPFLKLRETVLGYHGEASDFTNLSEIRIGWFGPQGGTNQPGAEQWWAANLAICEANEQGGFRGLPFRLVPRWAVDPWGTGVSQLARMVYDDQPLALLGSVDSAATHLAEQVVAKANLPLLSPVSTDKSVTLAGVSWMFSCAPADDAIARVLVADLLPAVRGGTNKLALLAGTEHESRMFARELMRQLAQHGRQPDFRFDVPADALSIAEQVTALEESHAGVVIIVAGAQAGARLASAVRAKLPAIALFGSHAMGRNPFLQLAGPAAEGVRFPLLFTPSHTGPAAARFLDRFAAEHHHPPDYTAALTYDATCLLIEAIGRAGPNRARIREALTRLSPWPGIAGVISFDGTGQNTRTNIGMGTIRDGVVIPVRLLATFEHASNENNPP